MSILNGGGKFHLIQIIGNFIIKKKSENNQKEEAEFTIFKNANENFKNVAEMLKKFPRGSYTGCRTVNGNRWLSMDLHHERLLSSTIEIFYNSEKDKIDHEKSLSVLRHLLVSASQKALSLFSLNSSQNFKLTIHITQHPHTFIPHPSSFSIKSLTFSPYKQTLWLCISPLPHLPCAVQVKVSGVPRENPTVKDTEWVREREKYEKLLIGEVNEVLLMTDEGEISEGLSSNFFVIYENNEIQTAEDDFCLLGSIRDIILKASEQKKWKINKTAPNIKQVKKWKAAFITSTSRLTLPISEIESLHPKFLGTWEFSFNDPFLKEIQNEVASRLEEDSFPLLIKNEN